MTKERLIEIWHNYRHITKQVSLYDAYKKPSDYKIKAYHNCLQYMRSKNGWSGTIIWHNCQLFTYGFMAVEGFYYITAYGTYFVPTKDLPIEEVG